jgi:hypothetical protein
MNRLKKRIWENDKLIYDEEYLPAEYANLGRLKKVANNNNQRKTMAKTRYSQHLLHFARHGL